VEEDRRKKLTYNAIRGKLIKAHGKDKEDDPVEVPSICWIKVIE